MSKVLMEGFKTKVTVEDFDAILLKNLLWYDHVNNQLKVGNKRLNYYYDAPTNKNVLTTLTQSELPAKNVLPVEFTTIQKA